MNRKTIFKTGNISWYVDVNNSDVIHICALHSHNEQVEIKTDRFTLVRMLETINKEKIKRRESES